MTDKFPGLTTPDDSYHGIVYAERFGKEGAFITKATAQLMRDFGSIQSPQNAFYLNLGLESLHVRMKRHAENGLAVAKFLSENENVAWVSYPLLEGDARRRQLFVGHLAMRRCSKATSITTLRKSIFQMARAESSASV